MIEYQTDTPQSETSTLVTAFIEAQTLATALSRMLPPFVEPITPVAANLKLTRDADGNVIAIKLEPTQC